MTAEIKLAKDASQGADDRKPFNLGHDQETRAHAIASLSTSQALVLALIESGAIDREQVIEALGDAIAYHKNSGVGDRQVHRRAVGLLEQLISDSEAADKPDDAS